MRSSARFFIPLKAAEDEEEEEEEDLGETAEEEEEEEEDSPALEMASIVARVDSGPSSSLAAIIAFL
jgi:hypothetical protein